MNKKHIDAFNKAFRSVCRSKDRSLLLNKKTRSYDTMIPLLSVTKEFTKFIDVVEKDLKLGKYRKESTKKATAKGKGRKK